MDSFTERHGYSVESTEITIRTDAPLELRVWLLSLVKKLRFSVLSFREIVCLKSYQPANPDQWSENEWMESEVRTLLENCRWHYIYDIIEETYRQLNENVKEEFELNINNFFKSNGYGWKLENGQILSRGDDAFEQSIKSAATCIETTNSDAYSEIKEALTDISKRPEPDVTGAIQHSMAAVECLCRTILKDEKPTLGNLIKFHRNNFSRPLDETIERLWGFASEKGRHLKEGKIPKYEEAEFVVHICASLIPYLKATITN